MLVRRSAGGGLFRSPGPDLSPPATSAQRRRPPRRRFPHRPHRRSTSSLPLPPPPSSSEQASSVTIHHQKQYAQAAEGPLPRSVRRRTQPDRYRAHSPPPRRTPPH